MERLEQAFAEVSAAPAPVPEGGATVNPTLVLLETRWAGLPDARRGEGTPSARNELVAVWKDRLSRVHAEAAPPSILLALKIAAEDMDPIAAAEEGSVPVSVVDRAVDEAAARDLLLLPPSALVRPSGFAPEGTPEEFLSAGTFTLQWHVTSACDLDCLHCYDRTSHSSMPLARGTGLLREVREFCRRRHVAGQVSFTGGNPFLHPHFETLYRTAVDLGLAACILGNPVPRERLERVIGISPPSYFQVSLEGLPPHNDRIRGRGNFDSVLRFLDLLAEYGIFSVVMLTLTAENLSQVLPLAEILNGRSTRFAFNRLARFGAGASLVAPPREEFTAFLRDYLDAAESLPVLGRKDNLLNIAHRQRGEELFGGCTGYGCGAAFNFLSVLPDGKVHACRKFPSPVGDLSSASIAQIYDSPEAARYRSRSRGCAACDLRAVCGGCPAITAAAGLDPFAHRDPFCFLAGAGVPAL